LEYQKQLNLKKKQEEYKAKHNDSLDGFEIKKYNKTGINVY